MSYFHEESPVNTCQYEHDEDVNFYDDDLEIDYTYEYTYEYTYTYTYR